MRRIPPVCFVASIVGMSLVFSGCTKTGPPNVTAQHSIADEIRQGLAAGGSSAGGGGDAAPTQDPTGFATLRGTFRVDQGALGSLAPMATLSVVGDDSAICKPGGSPVYSDALRVDKTSGGIRDVVIFLTGKGVADSWIHESAQPGNTEEAVFDQKNCIFLSHVFALQTSQPLKVLNSDSIGHNTNLKPVKSPPFNQTVLANGSLTYLHKKEETQPQPYSVSCSIHPWMTAYIFPRDNSYVAVSGEDGTFEIPNLPSGVDLEFRVWHEKSSWVDYTGWKKGRFKVALVAGEETSIDIAIDPAIFN